MEIGKKRKVKTNPSRWLVKVSPKALALQSTHHLLFFSSSHLHLCKKERPIVTKKNLIDIPL
jgi:hypothetical protein